MHSITKPILPALLAGCMATAPVAAHAATIFHFQFSQEPLFNEDGPPSGDGPLIGPIVGSGTFTSPIDLAPGTYDLSSLSGFGVSFSFADGSNYSTTDITTPLTGVAVEITDLGGGFQRLFFTEGSGVGANLGGYGGALDLFSGSNVLSFEPTSFGGNFLYLATYNQGRYLALGGAVPELSTWAMMLLGFGLVGGIMRSSKRRHRFAVSYS